LIEVAQKDGVMGMMKLWDDADMSLRVKRGMFRILEGKSRTSITPVN
jgi:hypothetical protein